MCLALEILKYTHKIWVRLMAPRPPGPMAFVEPCPMGVTSLTQNVCKKLFCYRPISKLNVLINIPWDRRRTVRGWRGIVCLCRTSETSQPDECSCQSETEWAASAGHNEELLANNALMGKLWIESYSPRVKTLSLSYHHHHHHHLPRV